MKRTTVAIIVGLGFVEGACGADASAQPQALSVLDTATGYLRHHITYKTLEMIDKEGKPTPVMERKTRRNPNPKPMKVTCTPFPPENWQSPEFDDRVWDRAQCAVGGRQHIPGAIQNLRGPGGQKFIALRGKFEVTDPAAVPELTFTAAYHGGIVVTLNGKEIGRANMPAGELTPETTAELYPTNAYVAADGKQPNPYWHRRQKEYAPIFARRERSCTIRISGSALRKGVNVLAVALHRSLHRDLVATAPFLRLSYHGAPGPWPHCRLEHLRLTVPAGTGGIVSNARRPDRIQVWRQGLWPTYQLDDYGDPFGPVPPIRLTGCRNGRFSDRLVISSPKAIEGLRVAVSDLKADGGAVLASDAVAIRYALHEGNGYRALVDTCPDPLPPEKFRAHRKAPAQEVAARSVWVTVCVPPSCKPGSYSGTVTVTAKGMQPVRIPLSINVHAWALPDPQDFVTHNNIWQTHDASARHYDVPVWSDRHFELMGEVLALSRPLANKFCQTHLIEKGMDIGNSQSFVRWIRKSDAGSDSYSYDFSVFDRYLDLYEKNVGKPSVMMLDVWRWGADQAKVDGRKVMRTTGKNPVKVTRLDPETGKTHSMEQPLYGTPESLAFWKPVLLEVKQRLEKRGWADVATFGTASDNAPRPETVRVFQQIWPEAQWLNAGHFRRGALDAGKGNPKAKTRVYSWVWGSGVLWKSKGREKGSYPRPWKNSIISLAFPRDGTGVNKLKQGSSLATYRLNPENTLQCNLRGIGRLSADCWTVPGVRHRLCGSPGQYNFWASILEFFAPLKDGPAPTNRSEMFREGLQIRQAITYLLQTLDAGKLDKELADKVNALVNARAENMVRTGGKANVLENDDALFGLCAEVAKKGRTRR